MKLDNICGSIPDDRDYIYVPLKGPFADSFDMKPKVYEIEDQGQLNLCVDNAIVTATEAMKPDASGSRMFVSYNVRHLIEDTSGNVGSSLRDGVRAAAHWGIPKETTWAYDASLLDVVPSAAAYDEGKTRLVTRYERIDIDAYRAQGGAVGFTGFVDAMKSAMTEGMGVLIATPLNQDFQTLKGPWQTQKLGERNAWNPWIGNHAMYCMGWDNAAQNYIGAPAPGGFLVENSWNKTWGDGGFCGWSYGKAYSEWIECWVIRGFADVMINPVQYVTPPMEILQVFRDLHYWDAMTIDDPAVLFWANDVRGKKFLIETMRDNFVDNANKMITSLP